MEEKIDRNYLKYGANKYVYNFQKFQTIRSFCGKARPRSKEEKEKKQHFWKWKYCLWGQELTLNFLKSCIFPLKISQGKGL